MVVKMHKNTASMTPVLDYNERKVKEGVAVRLSVGGDIASNRESSVRKTFREFDVNAKMSRRGIKDVSLQIDINL